MAKANENKLMKEQIEKAMDCGTVEEIMELAKSEGVALTKEEAEAYLAERDDVELREGSLMNMAGGSCNSYVCSLVGL